MSIEQIQVLYLQERDNVSKTHGQIQFLYLQEAGVMRN